MSTNVNERIPEWTLGDRLRKARLMAGLEQQEFADELGISRGTVHNYEMDRTRVKRPFLLAWSMRTGVPMEWLERGVLPAHSPTDGGQSEPFADLIAA